MRQANSSQTPRVRPPAVAGSWYPGEAEALRAYLQPLLAAAEAPAGQAPIRALLAPHAGYRFSGPTAAKAFGLLQGRRYRRVIVLAPSHRGRFHGLSISEVTHYRTPLGDIPLDLDAAARLNQHPLFQSEPAAHEQEHSIEMQLPMLQAALAPGWRLLPILVSMMHMADYHSAAEALRPWLDEETLLVLSGDFTHYGANYGYQPFPADKDIAERLHRLDMGAFQRVVEHDAAGLAAYQQQTGITACAYGPLMVLLPLLDDAAAVDLIAYTTSGELTGDYQFSVSYLSLAVRSATPLGGATAPQALPEAQLHSLHQLACLALRAAVEGAPEQTLALERYAASLPGNLRHPAGAFVTLTKGGQLRGCIGYILPQEPLYKAVMENARNAALKDHRFAPVSAGELEELTVEISVLTPPAPIASWQAFEPGRQGIILQKAGRRAVFLPEVATQQGWGREQTLSHLAAKAGLPPDAWREGAEFFVFTTQTHTAPMQPAEAGNKSRRLD